MSNRLELFSTIVGSHMWKMDKPTSDIDLAVVYMVDSKNVLLGGSLKGSQKQEGNNDIVYYEISHVIDNLLKGNCNYQWAVMSPLIKSKYKSALSELREIVSRTLAKNSFYSINGLSTHNIYHFIEGASKKGTPKYEIDPKSDIYKKKLNVIGRTLKYGINLLLWGKCIFEKADIKNSTELYELKNQLNEAYKNSHLPDKPDKELFEKYLIKWRLHKLRLDGYIEK